MSRTRDLKGVLINKDNVLTVIAQEEYVKIRREEAFKTLICPLQDVCFINYDNVLSPIHSADFMEPFNLLFRYLNPSLPKITTNLRAETFVKPFAAFIRKYASPKDIITIMNKFDSEFEEENYDGDLFTDFERIVIFENLENEFFLKYESSSTGATFILIKVGKFYFGTLESEKDITKIVSSYNLL